MRDVMKHLIRSPQGAVGLFILVVAALMVCGGAHIAPYDPESISILARYKAPSAEHWFGTDQLGRDIFSRVMVGARATIVLSLLATLMSMVTGAVIGTASAYLGGKTDEAIMRTMDAVMSIPSLLFALLIVSTLGQSSFNAVLAITIAFVPGMVRIARSVSLAARQQDYVSAAIARGEATHYIILREMLPNIVAPIIVEATIRVAFAIMLFATLSFLGLGAQPPEPEWGLMVSEARAYFFNAPWMMLIPGVAIALVAIGFNLLGDGLRDALNPRSH
ncbi:binding-protein-dependent transport systems inner membrane component [Rahnella aceris]|jgi:peptide/nickel transport system permease protein|uniref:Binding-protein-dependent transport systems inner membrane component n=1 Tax=Rahnella sp. (strain Y9602) TaxID=2703885 RepID=A0A0H3FD26_RAHSY|nr:MULTISPECIES: ABC transporter permease [Rahnella]AFE58672.1 binding-protein-dependent transport system inner membrane protein [Rahnella aquatilis HX2]AYA07313.1 ABC transporter permease [Rahnella aquatilis]ADW74025.1 binding-protein-dependent transport systems inner membrane component [Rahnella aceris]AZP51251.1 ABC transporter permease [Rahnella aquatilis]MBU9839958.1 ABC transporter permease [Rahnella aceris]